MLRCERCCYRIVGGLRGTGSVESAELESPDPKERSGVRSLTGEGHCFDQWQCQGRMVHLRGNNVSVGTKFEKRIETEDGLYR